MNIKITLSNNNKYKITINFIILKLGDSISNPTKDIHLK